MPTRFSSNPRKDSPPAQPAVAALDAKALQELRDMSGEDTPEILTELIAPLIFKAGLLFRIKVPQVCNKFEEQMNYGCFVIMLRY